MFWALSACGGSSVILGTELHSGSNISLCFYFSLVLDSCYLSVGTSTLHSAYIFTQTSLLLCGTSPQTGLLAH